MLVSWPVVFTARSCAEGELFIVGGIQIQIVGCPQAVPLTQYVTTQTPLTTHTSLHIRHYTNPTHYKAQLVNALARAPKFNEQHII